MKSSPPQPFSSSGGPQARCATHVHCDILTTLLLRLSPQKTRYEIYVSILKEGGKELLSHDESEAAGLKKSHSSPSLNPESSPITAKVKRNVSERKDHRPETPSIKQKVT